MSEGYVNPLQTMLDQRRRWLALQSVVHDEEIDPGPEPVDLRIPRFRRMRWSADREGIRRHLEAIRPIDPVDVPRARDVAWQTLMDYRAETNPREALVFAIPAGVGKTWLGERAAVAFARQYGDVTALLMPRHEHFLTLKAAALRQGIDATLLYHWLPVQGPEGVDGIETCRYPGPRSEYQRRGYDGLTFCAGVDGCGWAYIRNGCVWHAQRAQVADQGAVILCMQHQHLYLGHPLSGQCDFLIGDENPLSAAVGPWLIPAGRILPAKLAVSGGMAQVLRVLHDAARAGQPLFGRPLVDACAAACGGDHLDLLQILRGVPDPDDPAADVHWEIRRPEQVVMVDYNHVPTLAKLLRYEVESALEERPCAPRVQVTVTPEGGALLLLKPSGRVTWRVPGAPAGVSGFPPHALFLDATAAPRGLPAEEQARYYSWLIQRPARIVRLDVLTATRVFQVHSRANSMTSLFAEGMTSADESVEIRTKGFDDVVRSVTLVARSYLRDGKLVGIIGYKKLIETHAFDDLVSMNPDTGEPMIGWYGAERGTNKFEPAFVLICIGVPQPPPEELHRIALCVVPPEARTKPFATDSLPARVFEEHLYGYMDPATERGALIVRPMYVDDDLRAFHWQTREGEIVQAVNRIRGVLADPDDPKHVWLFLNLPVDELAPDRLLELRDVFDAPTSVDPTAWGPVRELALSRAIAGEALTTSDLVEICGVSRTAANEYIVAVEEYMLDAEGEKAFRWPTDQEKVLLPRKRGGGRGPKFVLPLHIEENN